MAWKSPRSCTMGVDTGKELHVVISRRLDPKGTATKREVVWIGTAQGYEELDDFMKRFRVVTPVDFRRSEDQLMQRKPVCLLQFLKRVHEK